MAKAQKIEKPRAEWGSDVVVDLFTVTDRQVVGDGVESVGLALTELCDDFAGLVVTTGGTGFGPRDLTPEGTMTVIDREAPGLAEAMRLVSPLGRLSRAVAGTRDQALSSTRPGPRPARSRRWRAILDVVPHALDLLAGGHPHCHALGSPRTPGRRGPLRGHGAPTLGSGLEPVLHFSARTPSRDAVVGESPNRRSEPANPSPGGVGPTRWNPGADGVRFAAMRAVSPDGSEGRVCFGARVRWEDERGRAGRSEDGGGGGSRRRRPWPPRRPTRGSARWS